MGWRALGGADDLGYSVRFGPVVFILIALAACSEPIGFNDLSGEPEADLLAPNSTVIGTFSDEAGLGIEGPEYALFGKLVHTDAAPSDIEAFYESELAERGWRPADDPNARVLSMRSTEELGATTWRKSGLVFRLGILDLDNPSTPADYKEYAAVYRIILYAVPEPTGSPG